MTIRHFKIFLEVCLQGSMTIAAQNLYISQPAVSQAIKELEAHYKVTLFTRNAHKLVLTSDGHKLFEYAHHMVGYNEFIEDSMSARENEDYLKAGSISGYLLTDLVSLYRKEHPSLNISIVHGTRDDIDSMLRSSSLDVAIVDGIPNSEVYESFFLDAQPMLFLCNKNTSLPYLQDEHPVLSLKQLASLPLHVWRNLPDTNNYISQAFHEQGLKYLVQGRYLHFDAILRSIHHDLGIGLVSNIIVKDDLDQYKVISVPDLDNKLFFKQYLIYHKRSSSNEIVLAFRDFVINEYNHLKEHCLDLYSYVR